MSFQLSARAVRFASAASLLAIVAACTSAPEPSEARRSSMSKEEAGRWNPPESSASGTPDGINGEKCSGGIKAGAKQLGDQLAEQFSTTYGGYSCRANTANTKELSIHAVGRALDINAKGAAGDEIANHLVNNAESFGIQRVIWNHTIWQIGTNGPTSRKYTGPNPHTDHVHAEVTIATATNGPGEGTEPSTGTGTDTDIDSDTGKPTKPTNPNTGGFDPNTGQPTDPNRPGPQDGYDPGFPGGAGWYEGEVECRAAADCDPSGTMMCVDGYCDYWGPPRY
jgi:hypothetical protein